MIVFVDNNIYNAMAALCAKLGCSMDQGMEFAAMEWMKGGFKKTINESRRLDKIKGATDGPKTRLSPN
jgi:hypothetical protein